MNVWTRFGPALSAAVLLASGCAGATTGATGIAGANFASDVSIRPGRAVVLFDGSSLEGWQHVGPGRFVLQPDGSMVTEGGMGLLYYTRRPFRDFVLELDYKAESEGANSGIFVRFPERPDDPWGAVRGGYEIQIDNLQDPLHMTGAIYSFAPASRLAARPAGEWNHYRIEVVGERYQVYLNGQKVNDFFGTRGREGYIGLQNHDPESRVHFRNVRVTPLTTRGAPENLADFLAVREQREPIRVLMVTATHGFRHEESIPVAKAVMQELERTTEFTFEITEDINAFTPENLAQYDLLFFANSTLRAEGSDTEEGEATYTIIANTPEGQRKGELVLSGTPGGEMTGTITVENDEETELEEVTLNGSDLAFAFTAGQTGRIQARAKLEGESLRGTVTMRGNEVPLTGTRTSGTLGGEVRNYTPVNEAQQQAILDYVRSGKGVAVAHAGLDAFYGWDEYREMVGGGLFESYPWTQPVRINVEDHSNPAVRHLGDNFWHRDEIYVLDQNPRWNSRVLLSLDMPSVGVLVGHPDATRDDYPISWIRPYGEGRVFATKLGHFADVWRNPAFLQHLLSGMRQAAGRAEADFGGQRVKETLATDVWATNLAIDTQHNVWIVELTGKVHRWDAATKQTELVGEIPTTDPAQIEHGLYDVEIDPNFYNGEPYVYAYYAQRETFINTLSRFEFQDGKIDLSTERVLLRVPTEPQCCHQAGDLEWGPEGTLFVSTGDTGQSGTKPDQEISEERIQEFVERNDLKDYHWSRLVDVERTSQNLQDLRGKILRINKDGSIPKDNPFYGKPGVRWEIYAYGLRNPYRFKYDAPTGRLYIAVVGPDEQTTYDWYNVAERGGENFGWPRSNGRLFYNEWTPQQTPGYVPPMWEYTYAAGSRSATFGPIYRAEGANAFPGMQGKAFVFDWSRKWIKYGDVVNGVFESDTAGSVRNDERQFRMGAKRLINLRTFDVLEATSPIGMELGRDGCLYLAEFDGFWRAGPQSNLSRYCWVEGRAPAATPAATEAVGARTGGSP
jgi:glucose/arabinose dehydrogenase